MGRYHTVDESEERMPFYIKPEEYLLTDYKRGSLLRHVARHRCENCGCDNKVLAVELAQVFGGDKGKMVKIQPPSEIMLGPRDRQITQMKIDQASTREIAAKYGITVSRVKQIVEAGLNRKWKSG